MKVETISDILFANKISKENLDDHKKLIQDLLQMINEKRDEIYLLKANLQIAEEELQLWIYDYDSLKINKEIRNRLKEINVAKIFQNVNDEMAHKTISKDEKNLLINADRYLIGSGQRNYFFEQKQYYLEEVQRLTTLYQKHYYKKKTLKKNLNEAREEFAKEKKRLEKDLTFLRDKLAWDRRDFEVQTSVDLTMFKKMQKNHEIVIYQKRLTQNKLNHFIEKIQYNYCKQKPMQKKSLINLIPEIYNEKMDLDTKCELDGMKKLLMDDFFYKFISDKFKLKKIIKKNCEQTILSIIKYSLEDNRIDLIRRFLGIGEEKIRREILDIYLIFLKNLPISFFKMFDNDYSTYVMSTELCFELYSGKFYYFDLIKLNQDMILNLSEILVKEEVVNNVNKVQKFDYFLLSKMYFKCILFINEITNDIKSEKTEINPNVILNIEPFVEQFQIANSEFEFTREFVLDLFKRNFIVSNKYVPKVGSQIVINIDSFLSFFTKKYTFKIKIIEFLDSTLECLVSIYDLLEKKINKVYEISDVKKQGYIMLPEFEEIMIKLVGNTENRWKINEYFLTAVGSQDKEILSKEEFTIFCMNTKEILLILLNEIKR